MAMEITRLKILIIDDDESIRELVARTLQNTEFQVIQVKEGREGLQLAKEQRPDLILLDIMMPRFDGFMAGKVLKRNAGTKDIPIIYLSGKKTKQDITAAIQAGGSDYIVKPFNPSDMLTRIRKLIGSVDARKNQKLRNETPERDDEYKGEPPVNEEKKRPAETPKRFQEMNVKSLKKQNDVVICPDILPGITFDHWLFYRNLFAHLISDNMFKVILNMKNIIDIDGSGLALLLSVNESLQNYKGRLVLTRNKYPVLVCKNKRCAQVFQRCRRGVEKFRGNWRDTEK